MIGIIYAAPELSRCLSCIRNAHNRQRKLDGSALSYPWWALDANVGRVLLWDLMNDEPKAVLFENDMQIDLSLLRGANVDPEGRIARVAGGSLLGDVDHEAMAHGLVTTCGTVSHTGVGGLTLGGGFGRLARRFGLALDNVRAVEIVTATGAILRANAHENADLFWGVRGGGGNFGVVTAFDFALHPMQRQVVGGTIMFPRNQAKDVLAFYADYEGEAPDDLALDAFVASNLKFTGANGAGFSVCYSGPVSRAEEIMPPMLSKTASTPSPVRRWTSFTKSSCW